MKQDDFMTWLSNLVESNPESMLEAAKEWERIRKGHYERTGENLTEVINNVIDPVDIGLCLPVGLQDD